MKGILWWVPLALEPPPAFWGEQKEPVFLRGCGRVGGVEGFQAARASMDDVDTQRVYFQCVFGNFKLVHQTHDFAGISAQAKV